MTGAVKSEHARAVSSDHPFATNRNDRRDPVVLEAGGGSRVVDLHVALFQLRKAAQRARHQFIARHAERIHMVVDQSLKGVHAARAGGVEKCQPCRRRQGQAVLIRKRRR